MRSHAVGVVMITDIMVLGSLCDSSIGYLK